MFGAFIDLLPVHLADFSPLKEGCGGDQLNPVVCAALERAAEDALGRSWPEILASHYRAYVETGDRARFEERYFQRRLKLNDLVLGEWATGNGRYLADIIDGIMLICEESGWQLPAHNSYVRGGPRLSLPRVERPVVDLFAAETAAILCVCRHLLGARLDGVDPAIGERIDHEVRTRVLRPYLTEHFWWMGHGDERMNNWTAWITQNVLLSTFLLPTEQPMRREVAAKALNSLDAFIKDYAEDGACEEGVVYYRHAALCMFGAIQILDQTSKGVLKPLWHEVKIRNMAEFIRNMHVSGNYYFNFADSSAVVPPCGVREYLFGKAVVSSSLMSFAAADYQRDADRLMPAEWNLWYRLQAAQAYDEIMDVQADGESAKDAFYAGIGLLISRDDLFSLAVKAGNNGESHNHNDVGSFTLFKSGRPVLIDVGVETYNARTFSPRRYEIWTMQSGYHNLPSFGGVMQADGPQFAAQKVDAVLETDRAGLSMELAGAYPPEADVKSFRREVMLHKGRYVEMIDRYEAEGLPVLSLMVLERPVVQLGLIELPGLAALQISGADTPRVEEIPVEDARLRKAWPDVLYRILIPAKGPELVIRIV